MKKKLSIVALFVLVLVLSFFLGTPLEEKNDYLPEKKTESVVVTEEPTMTPQPIIESTKAPTFVEEKKDSAATPIPTETIYTEVEEKLFCTLSVRCDAVANNLDLIKEEKREIVPSGGIIYPEQPVEFADGESVFDVLLREMRDKKIHLEFVDTPMYDSVYIEGIGNIYEFDCGDCSGWMYRVNGVKPNYGSSQYALKNGDRIEFYYSTNFMEDK